MMLRLILWKEYREQRATWLALAVLAAAAILGVGLGWGTYSTQSEPMREILVTIAAILAWTYGMVCGAMLPRLLASWGYSSVDRGRRLPARRSAGGAAGAGWQSLWLAWSQTRGVALLMAAVALVGGGFALLNFSLLWPFVSLLLGVVCGA